MADPLAPDDHDLRAELRRATSALPGGGADFADLTRRVRRRRASQAALRGGIPALCVVLMGGGLWALTRRGTDADRPAAPTTSIDGPSTTPTSAPTTSPSTVTVPSTGPAVSTSSSSPPTTEQETTIPDTVATTEPALTTTAPPVDTTIGSEQPLGQEANVAGLDLALTGSAVNLVSVTDGTTVYVWSAADGKGVALDPVTLAARPIASMPMAAAPVQDGTWTWADGRAFVRSVSSFALYDPAGDRWTSGALPEPRSGLSVTVWTGSRVLVWGGLPSTDGAGDTPLDGLLLDPGTGTWTRTSTAPSARVGEISAAYAAGEVAIVGDAVGNFDTAPLLLYRPATDTWREVAPPVALPYTPFVTARGDRLVLIALNHTVSAEYDPSTGVWTTSTPTVAVNNGRHTHLAASDGQRVAYVAGDGTVAIFDGASWRPAARIGTIVFDAVWAGGRLVTVGATTASVADWAAQVTSTPPSRLVGI